MIPFSTLPAGTLPGQRTIIGARKPPSMTVPLPAANGVWPPSGQVKFSAPVVGGEADDGVAVETHVLHLLHHRSHHVVELGHAGFLDGPSILRGAQTLVLVRQVGDHVHARGVEPEEKRLAVRLGLSTKARALARISSSMVSMRFGQSSPASSIFCFPILPQRGMTVASSTFVAQEWTMFRGPTVAFSVVG